MSGLAMPATLKHIEKTGEIGIQVGVRILQRITNAGLCGQMHDRPELGLAKDAFDDAAFGEIDLMESKFVEFPENGQTRLLQCRIVIIVDAVHADHRAAAFKEPPGQRKADETRGAGDQDGILRHDRSSSEWLFWGLLSVIAATARSNRGTARDRAATSRQALSHRALSTISSPAANPRARTAHARPRKSPRPPAASLPAASGRCRIRV